MSQRRLALLFYVSALLSYANSIAWFQSSGIVRHCHVRNLELVGGLDPTKLRIGAPADGANPVDTWTKWDTTSESLNDSWLADEIPNYVLEYAPLVHLYSEEKFWPCDIAEHLVHVTPNLNYTPMQSQSRLLNLTNLDKLNVWDGGRFVYLTSNDNVEERPDWLSGQKNIPEILQMSGKDPGKIEDKESSIHAINEDENTICSHLDSPSSCKAGNMRTFRQKRRGKNPQRIGTQCLKDEHPKKDPSEAVKRAAQDNERSRNFGRSDAPAVLIVVDKGDGIVDAFWFFFYSYNLGNLVFNIRFGNHVGDWEHTLIRFQYGKPKYVFYSEHNFGSAYSYGAVEKIGKRPVTYSAVGTHAMYATPGSHPYVLPFGLLHDQTDRGPLWDPVLNSHMYTYNYTLDDLHASNLTPDAPIEWFYFAGHWGDRYYPLDDKRQYRFIGQNHYVSGPLGPRFKNLGRRKVCQGRYSDPCRIKNWLAPSTVKYWGGMGDGEDSLQS